MVKLNVLPRGKATCACGRLIVSYSLSRTTQSTWGLGTVILATPTLGLHSLGLGAALSCCALPTAYTLRSSPNRL